MAYLEEDVIADYIANLLNTNKATIGLTAVWFEGKMTGLNPPYAQVIPGPIRRLPTGTVRNPAVETDIYIYVIHTSVQNGAVARTRADLQLARKVVLTLHADSTLGGQIPGGFVVRESPLTVPTTARGRNVTGTELVWTGTQREVLF